MSDAARFVRPATRTAGFTLIELMVTITLLAILMSLSIPSFVTWIRNSQIRTVAEAVQFGLRTAQNEAMRRNRQVVIAFTNDVPNNTLDNPYVNATAAAGGKRWWLQTVPQFSDSSGAAATFITAGVLAEGGSAVTIAGDPSVATLCYSSNGRLIANASATGVSGGACTAAATTFTITQPSGADRPLRVIAQLGGQLRMCDPKRPTLSANSPDGCPP